MEEEEEGEDGEPGCGERNVHRSRPDKVAKSLSQEREDTRQEHTKRPQGFRLVEGTEWRAKQTQEGNGPISAGRDK